MLSRGKAKGKGPIRVAMAPLQWAPYAGGAGQVFQDVAEYLQGDEFSFNVYATKGVGTQPAPRREEVVEDVNGIPVVRSPLSIVPLSRRGKRIWDALSVYYWSYYSAGQFRHLRRDSYDLLISTPFPSFHNYPAFVAAKWRRKPIVFMPCIHLADQQHHRRSLSWMMCKANAVITLTEHARRFCLRKGVPANKVHTIGAAIRPNDYVATPGKMKARLKAKELVVFLARLEETKGVAAVIRAARLVAAKRDGCVFALAGSETDYSRALRSMLPHSLSEKIVFLGKVSNADKHALLADADVFVMPSTAESFGIVYLEAWMYHTPVIGANAGAVPYVISEYENGLLVEPGNHVELARKIELLLDHRDWAAGMGKSGKAKALASYTQDKVAAQFRKVFLEVLGRAGGAGSGGQPDNVKGEELQQDRRRDGSGGTGRIASGAPSPAAEATREGLFQG